LPGSELRLVKAGNPDTDELNGELVLMKLHPRRIILLNPAGLALWQGLDGVDTRAEVVELVKEALPAMEAQAVERSVERCSTNLCKVVSSPKRRRTHSRKLTS
jgi:hypothetical protein